LNESHGAGFEGVGVMRFIQESKEVSAGVGTFR